MKHGAKSIASPKAWHPSPFSKEENSLENLMANLVIAYWLSSLAQNWVPAPKAYLLDAGHGNNDSMDIPKLGGPPPERGVRKETSTRILMFRILSMDAEKKDLI